MENKPSISRLRRIKSALEKKQKKYVTLDMLSRYVGLYSDVVADELVYFEPMVKMDTSMNMMDILPFIQKYLGKIDEENKEKREKKPRRQAVRKKELLKYSSIGDFVYQKMAGPGGLVSPSSNLNDHDLHVLELLVKQEIAKSKKKKK
ncbi:MAG TPA: hypothetical protein DD384_04785 [Firmicutes bacterium]|nr:hypothetical protein [Bacillota bacterium]